MLVRAYLEQNPTADAAAALGNGARWIAEIVPEVADAVPDLPPPAPGIDPAQARFRLFDATATFLKRAGAAQPIALVLDDLHWADVPSLRMLEFVAAEITEARVLVIGTYRDNEVDRRHPLSNALGAFGRLEGFARIRLGGLEADEARALIAAAGGRADTVATMVERAEGHPLFITQLARYVGESGAAALRGLPAGLREAIGARLNRLSERCNEVLRVAAVIGRDFELGLLVRSIDGLDESDCIAALEEALAARIVEEHAEADLYRFSHALIRETLYDELGTPRRQRLHGRIAAAIEGSPAEDLSRLAHHYGAAPPGDAAVKAIEYARRAGEQAMRQLAYEEATRHWRTALAAHAALETREGSANADPSLRLKLVQRLGEAQTSAGEYLNARDSFREAIALARARGDAQAFARAAIGFEDASWRPGLSGEESIGLLRDALDQIGDGDRLTSARVLSALTRALIFTGAADAAVATNDRAIALARGCDNPGALADALCAGLSARWQTDRLGKRLAAAHEAMLICVRIGDKERLVNAASWRLADLLELGDTDAFSIEYEALKRSGEELQQPFWAYTAASFHPTLALMRGDLVESERAVHALRRLGERQPGLDAAGVFATQMFTLRREQGRLRDLAPVVQHFVATTPTESTWRPGLTLVFAELGLVDAARREFDRLAERDFADVPRDGMWACCIAYLAEVCAFLGDARRAEVLHALLLPYQSRNIVAGTVVACFGAGARHLGMLATVAGRWEDAERHFEQALAINTRQGARTWIAHTQAAYADLLRLRGGAADFERSASLRDAARDTAQALGLAGLLAKLDHAAAAPLMAQPKRR